MSHRVILPILAAVMVSLLTACATAPQPQPEKRHALQGEVIRLEEKDKVAIIKHEEIKDFMEAMTMGFSVPDPVEWAKLRPGMKIKGTVVERKEDFYLTGISEAK